MATPFRYDPFWKLVICVQCGSGIKPTKAHFIRHLRGPPHSILSREQPSYLDFWNELSLRSEHELTSFLAEQVQPVPLIIGLTVLSGFRCVTCNLLTTNAQLHHRCPDPSPVSDSQNRPRGRPRGRPHRNQSRARAQWQDSHLQTFFSSRRDLEYFSVTVPPSPALPEPTPSTPSPVDDLATAINNTHLSSPSPSPGPSSSRDADHGILPANIDESPLLPVQDSDNEDESPLPPVHESDNGDDDGEIQNVPQDQDGPENTGDLRISRDEERSDNEEDVEFSDEDLDYSDEDDTSSSESTDEDRVLSVEEQQDAVINSLNQAWIPLCSCSQSFLFLPPFSGLVGLNGDPDSRSHFTSEDHSLRQWGDRINRLRFVNSQVPDPATDHHLQRLPNPIRTSGLLQSREEHYQIPWRALLGADDNVPPLSLAKSEHEFLTQLDQGTELRIQRRWDIDSFIARVDSLAAFRMGFTLSLLALYTRRVTQRQYIHIDGWEVSEKKHAFLGINAGTAAFGLRLNVHIIFPNMPILASTHLTNLEQQLWVDQILLPALRAVSSPDELQHYPFSFEDARCRAQAKQERLLSGIRQPLDIQIHLPESKLAALWEKIMMIIINGIRQEGNQPSPLRAYQDPVLMVSGHGLKLLFKHDSQTATKDQFFAAMNMCFNRQYYCEDQVWVDLGTEDTPNRLYDHPQPVILLRKTDCLNSWTSSFELSRPALYPWHLTRDAASAEVSFPRRNVFDSGPGLVHNKAYNVHKVICDTPLKGHRLFGYPLFESLAYSPQLLQEWVVAYHQNGLRGKAGDKMDRTRLLRNFLQVKNRLATALHSSTRVSFGVRQEYLINLTILRELPEHIPTEDIIVQAGGEGVSHRPYWVLSAHDVLHFLRMDCQRWLLGIEFLISLAAVNAPTLEPALSPRQTEILNGTMLTALLRILRTSLAGQDPARSKALYKKEYPAKHRNPHGKFVDSGRTRCGLNLQEIITTRGVAGLPVYLVHWERLMFQIKKAQYMAFFPQGLGHLFQDLRARRIITQSERENRQLRSFLDQMRPDPITGRSKYSINKFFGTLTQLVVRAFVIEIMERIIRPRAEQDFRNEDEDIQQDAKQVLAKLDRQRVEDYAMFCKRAFTYRTVQWLMKCPPRIIQHRTPPKNPPSVTHHRPSLADAYNQGDWNSKLQGLFEWDDMRPGFQRGWHQWGFRVLTRRYYSLVLEVCGTTMAERFRANMGRTAARHLWIIPHYSQQHLSVLYKASKHNAPDTADAIYDLGLLDRTNWVAATVTNVGDAVQNLRHANGYGYHRATVEDKSDDERWDLEDAQRAARLQIKKGELQIWSPPRDHRPPAACLQVDGWYDYDGGLHLAEEFHELVAEDEEESSTDSSSETRSEEPEGEE